MALRLASAGTIFAAAIFLAAATPVSPLKAQEPVAAFDHGKVARTALAQHIQPGFQGLVDAFSALRRATAACKDNPEFRFNRLRPDFREAVIAWGKVAHLSFGPLAENNKYERVFFWLDRKGIARRQVARALRDAPQDYLDIDKLGERSIGVQGLPALEQLIVTPPRKGGDLVFKCEYAIAIAGNLESVARKVAAEWAVDGSWGQRWLTAGPENPTYLQPQETTFKLIRAFLEHSERIRDVELFRPLSGIMSGRALLGPFARSGLTMDFIAARITGLRNLIQDGGLAAETLRTAQARKSPEATQAIEQVKFELRFLVELSYKFARVPDFFNSQRKSEAISLGAPLKSARVVAETAFGLTTDIPVGFNATDGD